MAYRVPLESGAEPLPGYRLTQVLGKGGFAEVWEAARGNEKVALKFIPSSNTSTTVKEIKSLSAMQRLDYPGLTRMEQITCVPGYIVISMELAEGSMLDLLAAFQEEYKSPIELKLLLDYLGQVAKSIDFLNSRQHNFENRTVGFQHCDIKPSNLLLFGDRVKLADFGLSTPTYAPNNPVMRMGTIDFAPPEMHRGILSEKSDQYSLGVTYYFLRTGCFPFPPPENNSFVRSYSYKRPQPDLTLVPQQEEGILYRALDLDPTNRWSSCTEMIRKIREVHGFGLSGSGAGAGKTAYGSGKKSTMMGQSIQFTQIMSSPN